MTKDTPRRTALVLSGAVAKGPFHAGAFSALVERGEAIHAVVGTSAGALTAAMIGAGLLSGKPGAAAEEISRLWLDKAAWKEFAVLSGRSLLKIQGLFRSDKVKQLLGESVDRMVASRGEWLSDVSVTLVATHLNGQPNTANPNRPWRTTYEWPLRFFAMDYLDEARRARLVQAATASATFPGLFSPELVDGVPCVDGGAVNNAPLSHAIEDPSIERVIVVSPQPPVPAPPASLGGLGLLGHLVDILINERLHRDLQLAHRINKRLDALDRITADLAPEKREAIFKTLHWRKLEIVEIRPADSLPGNALTGFWDKEARNLYYEAGRRRAFEALSRP